MTETPVAKPAAGSAAKTLGEATQSSRESYHGDAKGAAKRDPGRKDPAVSGDTAPNKHNVPIR